MYKVIFLSVLLQASILGFSQNIYDGSNSLKYAKYLFENKDYNLATEEFERALFFFPDSLSVRNQFLESCFKSYNFEKGKNAIELYCNNDISVLPTGLKVSYLEFLLASGNYKKVENILNSKIEIDEVSRVTTELSLLMLQKDWESANLVTYRGKSESLPQKYFELKSLSVEACKIKYKKPLLAMSMSVVVPGMGKLYSGNSKDALIAFSLVAMNGWQAYRGFKKEGIKSTYGWAFASLSAGFYIGNIYGSYKAAVRRNLNYDNDIKHKAKHIIFP